MNENDRHVLEELTGLAESIIGEQGTVAEHRTMYRDFRILVDRVSPAGDVRALAADLYEKIDRVLSNLEKALPPAAFAEQRAKLEAANAAVVNLVQQS